MPPLRRETPFVSRWWKVTEQAHHPPLRDLSLRVPFSAFSTIEADGEQCFIYRWIIYPLTLIYIWASMETKQLSLLLQLRLLAPAAGS